MDALLKTARATLDPAVKQEKLEQMQDLVSKDAPALFLYNPDYTYWVSADVKGIDTKKIVDPSQRFTNVTDWFIKQKRTWN